MTNEMKEETKGMREEMKEMRGEMQNMGAGLQDGLEKLKIGNGELRRATESRETCRTRSIRVTEEAKVTVTERKKLNGVTETTSMRETRREVIEWTETREMGTVEERLHGVEEEEEGDAHTHTHTHTGSEGQWG